MNPDEAVSHPDGGHGPDAAPPGPDAAPPGPDAAPPDAAPHPPSPGPETPPGAPPPRRDPYATFGNPLHDTWGTRTPQQPGPPTPIHVGRQRRKRPGLRWAATILVIGLLAAGGWFARGALGDAWDWIYDKAESMTGDTSSDAAADPPATTAEPTGGLDPEKVNEAADANAAAFDEWMDANRDSVTAAVDRLAATNESIVSRAEDASGGSEVTSEEYRAALVELRDSTLGVVHALDDAPPSAIRDDFVRILLVRTAATNELITATDARDATGMQRATKDLQNARTETQRICRQYGKRAEALCE